MRKKENNRLILFALSLATLAVYFAARVVTPHISYYLKDYIEFEQITKYYPYLWIISISIILLICLQFLLEHKIYKGIKYFWYHYTIINNLELQLIDANYYIQRPNWIELPKIKLNFSKDFNSATLFISNNLKFENKLDKKVISSALGKYVVETFYLTDDENYYKYELLDGSISYKITFNSFNEFSDYNKQFYDYELFLDSRTSVTLQHALIVGATGSGKSNLIYNFLLQFCNRNIRYNLYFADPKNSGLSILGSNINENRTSVTINEIIELLEDFNKKMKDREKEIKNLLKNDINSDYRKFDLQPYLFIFEEYAAFSSVLKTYDKKTRDKVNGLLSSIVLMGRQQGFFLWIVMQKSDSTMIDTSIRDNLPLKICLGNAEKTTYVTIFGTGIEIPNKNYKVGEGVFTEPIVAPTPKKVDTAFCNFDILQAVNESVGCVTTHAPKNK